MAEVLMCGKQHQGISPRKDALNFITASNPSIRHADSYGEFCNEFLTMFPVSYIINGTV